MMQLSTEMVTKLALYPLNKKTVNINLDLAEKNYQRRGKDNFEMFCFVLVNMLLVTCKD